LVERRPFVIAGAGIGGLTAALALAAKGFRIILVERAAALSEIGAGIQLAPNAGRVLAALGLDEAIAAAAVEPASIEIIDGRKDRPLTSIRSVAFRGRYGFPYRVIHRADLQKLLAAAADRIGVGTILGATIEDVVSRPNELVVRIRKGSADEVMPAEAVVAADGVWSSARGRIPGAAAPAPTGRTAWRAIIPADVANRSLPLDRVGLWLGPDAHLVHYPVAGGAAISMVAIVEENWTAPGWSAAGDRGNLAARFSDWSRRAREAIAAAPAWQKFAIMAVDPTRPWLDGRLVLLGDAAHAMPPFLAQGAAMAIEDATVLADALAAAPDTASGLRAYVAARQPRTAAVAEASRKAGKRFHLRGLAAAARNIVLGVAGERLALRQNDAIYRWQPNSSN
jgi:salicylate hydroxylase